MTQTQRALDEPELHGTGKNGERAAELPPTEAAEVTVARAAARYR